MFAGMNWQGVALDAVLSFVVGWFWASPNGLCPACSILAGVNHGRGDQMGGAIRWARPLPVLWSG